MQSYGRYDPLNFQIIENIEASMWPGSIAVTYAHTSLKLLGHRSFNRL